jgi:hypothetical protein
MTKRHVLIPDPQVRRGVPLDHLDWAARAIIEYDPTSIHILGDWHDMPSLSSHDKPGSKRMEGARYREDIDAGNEAHERFISHLKGTRVWRRARKKKYLGNHEDRITRCVANEPKFEGAVSLDHIDSKGFEVYPYLEPVWEDGIVYSHFFQNTHSPAAIGGQIPAMLAAIGDSFCMGHVQGLKYANRMYPTGKIRHGLVAGSFYQHDEHYRGPQGRTQNHWNGIVVLNDVRDGNYEIMPLSLDFLRRRFGRKKK